MKKRYFIFLSVLFLLTAISVSSCKKKCDIGTENTYEGDVISDAIIYPSSGYTVSAYNTQYFNGTFTPAGYFKVSFDGGMTKVNVDWSQYSILAIPMTVSCKAQFHRKVERDDANQVVKYTCKATYCDDCESNVYVENFILVPKIPSTYNILFIPEYQKK